MTEHHDGVRILRGWVYASPNTAGVRKLIGHLSFAVSSGLLSAIRTGPADAIIFSSPTMFAAIPAWLTARARRARFILEVRDLWPEIFVDMGVLREGCILRALQAMAGFLYRRADLVVPVTDGFAERIVATGIPRQKVSVVTNGADVDWFGGNRRSDAERLRRDLGLDGAFVVSYVGAHGASHGLASVIAAAEHLRAVDDVRFLLVGDGSEKAALERLRRERGLSNVLMLPQQPAERIRDFYAVSDICLVCLRDLPLFDTFIPSKMFEIMAAGRPIVGSVRGEARRILEASSAAVVTDPEDSRAIADAVLELRASPQRRQAMADAGPHFVRRRYARDSLATRYATLIAEGAR